MKTKLTILMLLICSVSLAQNNGEEKENNKKVVKHKTVSFVSDEDVAGIAKVLASSATPEKRQQLEKVAKGLNNNPATLEEMQQLKEQFPTLFSTPKNEEKQQRKTYNPLADPRTSQEYIDSLFQQSLKEITAEEAKAFYEGALAMEAEKKRIEEEQRETERKAKISIARKKEEERKKALIYNGIGAIVLCVSLFFVIKKIFKKQ